MPDGGVTTYSYDHADRLETLTDPRGKTTEFVYDALGRKIHTLLPNGATTTQVYNCTDCLTSIEHRAKNGTLISQIDYMHDFVGNRTRAITPPAAKSPPGPTIAPTSSPASGAPARPPTT
jgi:YD repeat-containing protein